MEKVKTKRQVRCILVILFVMAIMNLGAQWLGCKYRDNISSIESMSYKQRVVFERGSTKRGVFVKNCPEEAKARLEFVSGKFDKTTMYRLSYKKSNEKTYHVVSENIKFTKRNEEQVVKLPEGLEYEQEYILLLEKINNTDDKSVIDVSGDFVLNQQSEK